MGEKTYRSTKSRNLEAVTYRCFIVSKSAAKQLLQLSAQ